MKEWREVVELLHQTIDEDTARGNSVLRALVTAREVIERDGKRLETCPHCGAGALVVHCHALTCPSTRGQQLQAELVDGHAANISLRTSQDVDNDSQRVFRRGYRDALDKIAAKLDAIGEISTPLAMVKAFIANEILLLDTRPVPPDNSEALEIKAPTLHPCIAYTGGQRHPTKEEVWINALTWARGAASQLRAPIERERMQFYLDAKIETLKPK